LFQGATLLDTTQFRNTEAFLSDTPSERWAALSQAFAKYADAEEKAAAKAGQIAAMLGSEFVKFVGTTPERLTFHTYEPNDDPHNEYKVAASAFDAVSDMEDGRWGYGMGLELRGSNHYPRRRLRWSMFIDLQQDPIEIEVGLTGAKFPLQKVDNVWQTEPISEHIYWDIRTSLLGYDGKTPFNFVLSR
jgi:hypothetical protein